MLEKRGPHREAHLQHAAMAVKTGKMLLGGALADPVDTGLIVFKGKPGTAEKFAAEDPYVKNGLVTSWSVRQWNIVVGNELVD